MIDYAEVRARFLTSSYYAESIEHGLSDSEIEVVENELEATVPDDVRDFLQSLLPVGPSWPAWRTDPHGAATEWQEFVLSAFAFDVEHNAYWLDGWGERPADVSEAIQVARTDVATWPPLMRLFGHRCIPTSPGGTGNPVLSMAHPVDTIVYGIDLEDYFHHEFAIGEARSAGPTDWQFLDARRIEPWFTAFRRFS